MEPRIQQLNRQLATHSRKYSRRIFRKSEAPLMPWTPQEIRLRLSSAVVPDRHPAKVSLIHLKVGRALRASRSEHLILAVP